MEDLSEEQIEDFKEAFSLFDVDGDGKINTKELSSVMRAVGLHLSESDVLSMLKEVDSDGNGTVEFDEFLSLMASKIKDTDSEKELIDSFKVFDPNDTKKITVEKIKHILTNMGDQLKQEEVDELLKEADIEEEFDYEKFVRMTLTK